ncbi:MAG: signal peptidase II [Eubacteriales bacterium]|nr:signal peptidase II [Eubacteriales bacterium]
MVYAALAAALAAGDLGLKWLIEKQDGKDFPKPLKHTKGKIMLYHNHNAGFPFGFLEKYGQLVRTVPLVVTSALGGVLCYLSLQKGKTAQKLGLALVIGGSLSNLYDRFVRRYVVDYFSFQFGFLKKVVFNLGDLFVFFGAGFLMSLQLVEEIREKSR